ncbi:MAG: hypothetical protein IKS31_10585 [Clostridia bacterium]|nr:hypothetical protein [Clostridia bacterium]MBR4459391.1 hypothetical protein [Clostridia bacterium]
MTCAACGRGPLTRDEIGLTKKLINRGAEACYCLDCLAARFRVGREALAQMAEAFRDAGCTLFR